MANGLHPSYVVELLEESIALRCPIAVVLRDGLHFTDQVREIATRHNEDWARFEKQGQIRVSDIAGCSRIASTGADAGGSEAGLE